MNKKWKLVILISLLGLGYGGWTGVDSFQDHRFNSRLTSKNAKAGSMIKAIRSIEDPTVRKEQIAKLVGTYKDGLTSEQVIEITTELENDRLEPIETRASSIPKSYTDYLASKSSVTDMEKRAPAINAMLSLAKNTRDDYSANSTVFAVYQKYKSILTVDVVQHLKTFFRQIYQNTSPDEFKALDKDFATVLRERHK